MEKLRILWMSVLYRDEMQQICRTCGRARTPLFTNSATRIVRQHWILWTGTFLGLEH